MVFQLIPWSASCRYNRYTMSKRLDDYTSKIFGIAWEHKYVCRCVFPLQFISILWPDKLDSFTYTKIRRKRLQFSSMPLLIRAYNAQTPITRMV